MADEEDVEDVCQICMEQPPSVKMSCGHALCMNCCVADIVRINERKDAVLPHAPPSLEVSLEVRCFTCSKPVETFKEDGADVTQDIRARAEARLAPSVTTPTGVEQEVVQQEQQDSGWNLVCARAQPEHNTGVQYCTSQALQDLFSVRPKNEYLELCLLDGRRLTDADIMQLAPALLQSAQDTIRDYGWPRPVALDVRLIDHRCSDAGVTALIDRCLAPLFQGGWAYCHLLKAWQNEIGDNGCEAIMRLLKLQGRKRDTHLRELHLSDNRITAEGALALVRTCENIYPRADGYDGWQQQRLPLWLRLHRNHIDTHAFFAQASDSSFCTCRSQGPKSGTCKPSCCRSLLTVSGLFAWSLSSKVVY